MIILKFLAIVGAAFFGILNSFINFKDNNDKITMGGVIGFVGVTSMAILIFGLEYHSNFENTKEKEQLNNRIVELKEINTKTSEDLGIIRKENIYLRDKVNSLDSINIHQVHLISQLSLDNSLLSRKLSDAQKNIVDEIIGGDSYCFFILSGDPIRYPNNNILRLFQEGKNPIYGVSALITDLNKVMWHHEKGKNVSGDTYMDLGDLYPNRTFKTYNLGQRYEVGDNIVYLAIRFEARNGYWVQFIRLYKENGDIKSENYFQINGEKVPIDEKVSPISGKKLIK